MGLSMYLWGALGPDGTPLEPGSGLWIEFPWSRPCFDIYAHNMNLNLHYWFLFEKQSWVEGREREKIKNV